MPYKKVTPPKRLVITYYAVLAIGVISRLWALPLFVVGWFFGVACDVFMAGKKFAHELPIQTNIDEKL